MHPEAIEKIILTTERMERFWRRSHGWAPQEAADLLASARLDRQSSFAHTLHDYLQPFNPAQAEARQILGYATLRSLCEGVLKHFLAVWLEDYLRDPKAPRGRKGNVLAPDDLKFDRLIEFYLKRVDSTSEKFLRRIQGRGNAIHHFKDRDIGNQDELLSDIVAFGDFLLDVNAALPYPDGLYDPS